MDIVAAKKLLFVAAVVGFSIAPLWAWKRRRPAFADLETLASGALSEGQKQTVSVVTELNKFLVSLATLLFGAIGFYLTQYEALVAQGVVQVAFFVSVIFLGLTYYYAFRVYASLVSELSQNALGVKPGASAILYRLEMEFWAMAAASGILGSIFVYGVISP